ncbi:MAG: hypothetical protein ABEI74_01420 [Candidatus Pacearchaeota archaeon]
MVSKRGVLLIVGAVLLLSIFSLDFASSQVQGCCLETKNGNYCQNVSKTKCSGKFDTSACNEDPFGGQCDRVCNIDRGNSQCQTITRAQAKDEGIKCETSLCNPGCCVLSNGNGDWVYNQFACGSGDFRPKSDKVDRSYCASLATNDLEGSCLYNSGKCKPKKKKNCDGEFFPDKVCSELDGSYCEPKDEKVCHDGDIYYQDSCENNYEVFKKCNDNSYCATNSTGGKECKSFECNLNQLEGVEEDRVLENGESVCYYDGPAGNGADAPGTEHYKVACNKGELEPILCGDPNKPLRGREEVCVMNKQDDTSESGKDTYQAACVKNKVSTCYKIGKELNKITNELPKNDDNLENKLPSLRNKAVRHLKECRQNTLCQLTRTPRKPFLREDKRSVLNETVPTTRSFSINEEEMGSLPFIDKSRIPDAPKVSTNSSPYDRSNIDNIKGINSDGVKKSKIDYKSPYISTFYLESSKVESSIVSRAYCLPRFPPGRKDTCRAASMECEVTFTDQGFFVNSLTVTECTRREGDNCNCLSKETQKRMNNYCSRAGDCGLSVNLRGVKNSEFNLSNNIDYVEDGKSTNPGGGSPREWYDPIPEAMKLIRDIYNEDPKPKDFAESYHFWNKSEKSLVLNKNIGSASSIGEAISSGLSGSLLKPNIINSSYGDWYKNQNPSGRAGSGPGDSNTEVETVEYDCSPYEPKSLENDQNDINGCKEACNSGPVGCTAYKCENLAKECEAANPGFEKVVCHEDSKDDNKPPKIENIEYVSEDTSKDLKDKPQDLWELNDPISESVQTIKFNITTNEPAKCKFTRGNSDKRYSKLNQNHDSKELYLYEQTISFSSGDFDELADGPYMPGDKISRNVSVKCKDSFGGESGYGNTNQESRYINYDLEAAEDTNPPIIDSYSPKKDKDWEYNPNNFTLDLEVEDRSNIKCSYSYGNLQSFSKANYNFSCDNKIAGKNINCNTTLNQTKKGEHGIDIICKDNSDNKNVADPETYSYNITRDIPFDKYKRQYGLRIGNITANYELKGLKQSVRDGGNITTSEREPIVDISYETIKGKNKGKSQCSYSTSNMQTFVEFGEKSNKHNLKLDLLRAPSKIDMDFKCDDGVSVDSKNFSFGLVYDDQGPVIVKNETVEAGDLTITTNEPAQCSYSHESCKFPHSDGDPIWKGGQNSFSINQSTKWIPNRPYYIRCKDKYGNGRCSSINKASVINGPEVTRIWQESGDIRVKTDRQAKCYYSFDTCNFDVSDQEDKSMTVGGSSLKHVTQWDPSNTYHIKCEDQWGNPNPSCAAIVQPHSLK